MSRRRFAALALAAVSAVGTSFVAAEAQAAGEAPVGSNFDIWYYATDENGDRDRLFSADDLAGFVNQARCECNQTISTRIQLKRAMTTYDPTIRVQTFVGNRCADAQTSVNPQITPCLRVLSDAPNPYTKAINFEFSPLWLVAGVQPGGSQDLGSAEPNGTCESGQGDAGIWICIENGEQPDCQNAEFEVTGTQNKNSTGDAMGMAQGIHYDFDPPQTLPSNFSISAGDSALQIEWDQISTGDVSGFRVLCADMDGNPLPGHGIDPPSLVGINRGTTYFIARDLCPDGPFSGEDEAVDTGDDTTTGDGGSTGDLETSGGLETTGDTGGTSSESGTGAGAGSGSESGGGTTGAALPTEGIESLGYAYVCSGHISGTSQEARVTGLDNGVAYQILVVAYDLAGNPIAASPVLEGIPVETIDLWEQCEIDGDICGSGGFCNCTTDPDDDARGWFVVIGVLGFAVRRRRRR